MNDGNTTNPDGGGTSRRVFIQRAGLGLVGIGSLPALLAATASGVVRAGGARGCRRRSRREGRSSVR